MAKRLWKIDCLEQVVKLAAKYADQDPELKAALDTIAECDRQEDERHEIALKYNGRDCTECNKRFIPSMVNGYSYQCSIGCQLRARTED